MRCTEITPVSTAQYQTISIGQLQESPTNPRKTFSEEGLRELADSIKALGGLVQPIIVRPIDVDRFEVVAGARRFRAAKLANLHELVAHVMDLTDEQVIEVQLIENAQRQDVHPYEEAAAYHTLLAMPQYDVTSIAAKVGKSASHVYSRLKYMDLIDAAATAFLENRLTAGHALLIARLPREQQTMALQNAFAEDWRTKERNAVPVRTLAQWIRENLMLTLADAVFDREDVNLLPAAGPCVVCSKRTGANAVLFEDFAHDDRCMDGNCFQAKVDAHIVRQKQNTAGLIQITRAYYYPNGSGDEKVLTRNEYAVVEPEDTQRCAGTPAIVVEGPGRRGEVLQVCVDSDCAVHGRPNHREAQEAEAQARAAEWKERQAERERNREKNLQLLNSTLKIAPKSLTRADYELLVLALLKRLEYDEVDEVCARSGIEVDQEREPDYANAALAERARQLTEPQLIGMLLELALLPSGMSDEELEPTDLLVLTAERYSAAHKANWRTRQKSSAGGRQSGKRSQLKAVSRRGAKR